MRSTERSTDTPQTPGLLREVAFDGRNPDAKVLSRFVSASAEEDTSWRVVRSHPAPIAVNLPELDEFAAAPAVDYTDAE